MENSVFIKRHPVLCYYVLAFAISWAAVLAVTGIHGIPGNPANQMKMLPALLLAMLLGPVGAALSVTGLAKGWAGYRRYFARLANWRVGVGWYAVAFLAAPTMFTVIPLAMALGYPRFIPHIFTEANKGFILVMGSVVGLIAGIFEEAGWTGFAIPRLRLRFDTLTTGAMVGFLWGAWHLLINFWSCGTPSGGLSIPNLISSLIFSFGILPPFRLLMIYVWDHTHSVPVAMLMHAALTAGSIVLSPASMPGLRGIAYHLSLTGTLWIMVAVCAMLHSRTTEQGGAKIVGRMAS